MDRRSGGARFDTPRLRTTPAAARIAGTDALPAQTDRSPGAERNPLQMQLESDNIKLASVATDVLGVSGREMLRALIKGEALPDAMAELALGRLRAKRVELAQALRGRTDETQRILLGMQLQRVEQTEQQIEELERHRRKAEALPGQDGLADANPWR
jgi:hypothetical protein